MNASLTDLKRAYDWALAYVRYVEEGDWMAGRDDISKFWGTIFAESKRRNYPGFNEMLVMRRGFTYPLADRAQVSDREAEREYAEAAHFVVCASMPAEELTNVQESPLGCPIAFDFDGRVFSAGGLVNALTSQRVIGACARAGLGERPLRVLEIGAGYGQMAHQLLQRLPIERYVVCDLPENLFLSAFYLQSNWPERAAAFVGEDASAAEGAALVFVAPPFLEGLGGTFDLVVNSYSFQEMNRSSVEEYFAFVERSLSTTGVFYSLNAHGKAGIERPSQYPVERFELAAVQPVRRFPFQVFATVPYEIVMRSRTGPPIEGPALTDLRMPLDALGMAFQLGLHDELVGLCESFCAGTLAAADAGWLNALFQLFDAPEYRAKLQALADMRQAHGRAAVTDYLEGTLELAVGDAAAAEPALMRAAAELSSSHAQACAFLLLAGLATNRGERAAAESLLERARAIAPHLAGEMARLLGDPDSLRGVLASHLSLELDRPRRSWRRRLMQARMRLARVGG